MLLHVNANHCPLLVPSLFLPTYFKYTNVRHESTVSSPRCKCRQLHVLLRWVFAWPTSRSITLDTQLDVQCSEYDPGYPAMRRLCLYT